MNVSVTNYLYGDAVGGALDEIDNLFPRLIVHVDPVHLDQPVPGQQTRVVIVLHGSAGFRKDDRSHLRETARRALDDHGATKGEAKVVSGRRLSLDGELPGLG